MYTFRHFRLTLYFLFCSFAKEFGHDDWQAYGSYIHRWAKRYGIVNKAMSGTKESATSIDELDEWKEAVLFPAMEGYSAKDIYNSDETALFYKCLPHRTYCFEGEKPAGSAKCKDRLTLLIITNMDGSDHRKLSVIGKAKNPRCLQKKYKMQVKDMAVDWYASKNAWMTGDIHDKIMTKFNNQMRAAGHHVLYVCDNASSHQNQEYSHIKVLQLPPNATSIIQPLDQGIILSVKRRYKKKLAERYLISVENNKDANALLKQLVSTCTFIVHVQLIVRVPYISCEVLIQNFNQVHVQFLKFIHLVYCIDVWEILATSYVVQKRNCFCDHMRTLILETSRWLRKVWDIFAIRPT